MTRFHGVIPPLSTLFHPDGSFDSASQAKLIDNMIAAGVHGLFVLGSNGEAAHMTHEMRLEVAEFCVAHIAGRVPVLLGISVPSTAESIDFAKHAQAQGADGMVAINPYYSKLSDENIFRYFRDIASAVPLPMMVYNFPAITGQDISPELVLRLARACPTIIGLKDTVDTLSHIRRCIQTVKPEFPDFLVFSGYEEYLLGTLLAGGDGCVPASGNFAPSLTVAMYEAFRAGDHAAAFEVFQRLIHVLPVYGLENPFYGIIKQGMKMVGFADATTVLPPCQDPSPESIVALRKALVVAGLLPAE